MQLFAMKKERQELLSMAENFITAAERQNRPMTKDEQAGFDNIMAKANKLANEINLAESRNTLHRFKPEELLTGGPSGVVLPKRLPKTLSMDYFTGICSLFRSGGRKVSDALSEGSDELGGYLMPTIQQPRVSAAMYEGSNAAGGYAVPVITEPQIVPLAPQETALRKLASVVPTQNDLKLPIKSAKGTAAFKSEGDGTGTNTFGGTDPALTQKTLGAHMLGHIEDASWEALQDIQIFQTFITDDLLVSILELEEPKLVSGSGTGEPEGVLTGCDTTTAVSGLTLDGIYDLVATLNAVYHPGAAFLMARATGLYIRKLQRQANLFEPVWTRENGQDYLLGYPVEFSGSMPDYSTSGHKPIVFGDFKRGYLIGDRGGSGVYVKVLDQTKAVEGVTQFLAYRRFDARVRRSEALKAYVLA